MRGTRQVQEASDRYQGYETGMRWVTMGMRQTKGMQGMRQVQGVRGMYME